MIFISSIEHLNSNEAFCKFPIKFGSSRQKNKHDLDYGPIHYLQREGAISRQKTKSVFLQDVTSLTVRAVFYSAGQDKLNQRGSTFRLFSMCLALNPRDFLYIPA